MRRVDMNALQTRDGRYLLDGEVFSGIGYRVSAHRVEAAFSIEQGKLGSRLESAIVPGTEAAGVVANVLEQHEESYDGEPVSFQHTPYTGLAYEFRNQRCVSEELFVDGCCTRAVTWYPSGNVATWEILDEPVVQDIAWFENGQPKLVRYAERDSFELELRFNAQGLSTCVRVFGSYFDRFGLLHDRLRIDSIDAHYVKHRIVADESIYMSGDGIDDEILCSMVEAGGLARSKRLHVAQTLIGPTGIAALSRLDRLEHLVVECPESLETKESMIGLKRARPRLVIEWNGAKVGRHEP